MSGPAPDRGIPDDTKSGNHPAALRPWVWPYPGAAPKGTTSIAEHDADVGQLLVDLYSGTGAFCPWPRLRPLFVQPVSLPPIPWP